MSSPHCFCIIWHSTSSKGPESRSAISSAYTIARNPLLFNFSERSLTVMFYSIGGSTPTCRFPLSTFNQDFNKKFSQLDDASDMESSEKSSEPANFNPFAAKPPASSVISASKLILREPRLQFSSSLTSPPATTTDGPFSLNLSSINPNGSSLNVSMSKFLMKQLLNNGNDFGNFKF